MMYVFHIGKNCTLNTRMMTTSDTRRLEFLKLPTSVNLVNIINY